MKYCLQLRERKPPAQNMPRRKKARKLRVTVTFSPDEEENREAFMRVIKIILSVPENRKISQQIL